MLNSMEVRFFLGRSSISVMINFLEEAQAMKFLHICLSYPKPVYHRFSMIFSDPLPLAVEFFLTSPSCAQLYVECYRELNHFCFSSLLF